MLLAKERAASLWRRMRRARSLWRPLLRAAATDSCEVMIKVKPSLSPFLMANSKAGISADRCSAGSLGGVFQAV